MTLERKGPRSFKDGKSQRDVYIPKATTCIADIWKIKIKYHAFSSDCPGLAKTLQKHCKDNTADPGIFEQGRESVKKCSVKKKKKTNPKGKLNQP